MRFCSRDYNMEEPMKDENDRRKGTHRSASRMPAASMTSSAVNSVQRSNGERESKLFDNSFAGTPQGAVDFITNILESSTEYSIIGNDLEGKILLWNEGARRLYGYEP